MAGVTNYPFRSLCREFGAGLYVSEMITARGYLQGNALTQLLASSPAGEVPRSIQIYGADPVDVGEMVRRLVDEGADHIDLNLGCPVRKVTSHGGGAAIPVKPRLMARLVRAMVGCAGDVPVTVKVRKGIDDELLTHLDAGRVAQEEGAAAIGLHARTAAQLYAGRADWDAIGELKAAVSIAVLGNGDVWEAHDALRMMRASGCDGVIVGRGCLGRPWLFRELADVFDGREPTPPPKLGGVIAVLRDHAERMIAFFGERMGLLQMRKWAALVHRRLPRLGRPCADGLTRVETLAEMVAMLSASSIPTSPFRCAALRANRAKGSRTQRVSLPEGYRDQRDDDTPPQN